MEPTCCWATARRRIVLRSSGANRRKLLQVPEVHGPILTPARQQELVRMELHIVDGSTASAAQLGEQLAGPQVPQPHRPLLARAGNPLAVRGEFEGVDAGGVAAVGEDAALAPRVPELEAGVQAARGQILTIRVEFDTADARLMA